MISNQQSLLAGSNGTREPLATRMRPKTLADYIGQTHVIGAGSALKIALSTGHVPSMILWGPPGVGKTTLAQLIANNVNSRFCTLSAVTAGVKDIKQVVEQAKMNAEQGEQTLLFIDEVHRFNKSQQDALLPHIEAGLFTFIGATTENPSFELNNALLSRVNVYCLEALGAKEIQHILTRALNDENGLAKMGSPALKVQVKVLERIAGSAQGDARAALSVLEQCVQVAEAGNTAEVSLALLESVLLERGVKFDKGGDLFYDQISALHKSVRGSSPDASLYWLARMLEGGCDPLYLARRLIRMANEDIGIADPRALTVALNAWEVQSRLGSPEGELALAQAVVYLSVAPKSNSVYTAFKTATQLAREHGAESVPVHLRNAPTSLMKSLGHGDDYRYAHDYPNAYVPGEQYLPEAIKNSEIYQPSAQGLEIKIQQKLSAWAELNQQSDFQRYIKE